MTQSLTLLLGESFDYAGLYPPASLGLSEALEEYGAQLEGPGEWLVNAFISPAVKLKELEAAAEKLGFFEDGDPLAVVATLSPLDGMLPNEAVDSLLKTLEESSWLGIASFEVSLPATSERRSWLKHLKKLGQETECPVMLELGWDEEIFDFMVEAVTSWDDFGFKARMGGPNPHDAPPSAVVARFITECASMDVPFKFTAGLHHPLRHHDPIHGGWRHGFLNVLGAGLAAVSGDASPSEVEHILDMQGAGAFEFSDERLVVASEAYGLEELESFADYCFGIGTCSIDEPYQGLVRLGLV